MRRALGTLFVACVMAVGALAQGPDEPPPVATIDPGTVDFGDQPAKHASKPQRVTITNAGQGKLYIRSVTLSGDNREDFVLGGDHCTNATLTPGKSCVVDVVMTPTGTGPRTATLTVNTATGTQTATLTGNGINSADVPPR
jgi:hypothetical protein